MLAIRTPIRIESNLPPEECMRRVQAVTTSQFAAFKSREEFPFAGRIMHDSFSIRYRIGYRNDFRRRLKLRVLPSEKGCSLIGDLLLPVPVIIFSIIWISFVLLVGGTFGWNYFQGNLPLEHNVNDLLYFIPFGMILFLMALICFGLWLSKFSEKKLLERLQLTVQGRLVGA
jgi:hypothetical protein